MHVVRVFIEELQQELTVPDEYPTIRTLSEVFDVIFTIAATSDFEALVRRVADDVLLNDKFPTKLRKTAVKKIKVRALQKDLDQDVRDILCRVVDELSQ